MSFEVTNKVRVVRQSCCYGLERNIEAQVIQIKEETYGSGPNIRTRNMYLCYPTGGIGQQVALWHCDSCLELITEP